MRRVIGLCLVGLGTFLIVIAVVLPTFIVSQVTKFPLNEYETATLVAHNASYFDASTLTEKSPVTLQATYTIKGDAAAGTSSMAVWNEFSAVNDVTNGIQVQLQSRTFGFDRKTAQLVSYTGDSVNGKPTPQTGVLGYVFPMNAKKQTYDVYDPSLGKPAPFVYSGTTTVDGVQANVYIENVTPTQVGTVTVPGSLIGSTASSVVAPEYYSNRLVYDVDPETGALINVNEHEVQALYNPATNTQALTLFNADLAMTPASITSVMHLDNNGRNELTLLQLIIPIVLGVVGLIALIVGIVMMRGPRNDVEAAPMTPAPERAVVPDEPTRESLVPGIDDDQHEAAAESESPAENAEEARAEEANAEHAEAEHAEAEHAEAEHAEAEHAEAEHAEAEHAPDAGAETLSAPVAAETAEAPAAEDRAAEDRAAEAPADATAESADTAGAAAANGKPANGGKPAAVSPKHRRRPAKSAAEPESGAQ
jgi:hypothetical protein